MELLNSIKNLLKRTPKLPQAKARIVVAETQFGTWHYHLREVPAGEAPKLGGLPREAQALCGAPLGFGWDVQVPISAWGTPDGHSHWCKECANRARGVRA